MSDEKRERNYYYVRYIPSNVAVGDTLVWNGTEWVNTPAGGGVPGGGDITGAANVGTGEGSVFRDEIAGVVNLKTLKQGSNVSITNNANDVTIAATAGGGGTWDPNATETLTNKTINADSNTITNIENADIKAAAAIAKSKLANLDIVNADVNASAAIAKTKLANLDVVNADVNASAAIAKSKLANLDVVDADVNASAAIAWSKLNKTGSLINDLGDVAVTSAARGDIIVRDATQFINKTKGTANQVLAMDGTGTDPVWTTPSVGGGTAVAPEFTYLIYKDGANYKQLDGATGTITSGSDFADMVNDIITAISPAGTPTLIELGPGDFTIPAATPAIIIASTRVGNIKIKGQGIGITNIIIDDAITGDGLQINGDATAATSDLPLTVNATKGSTTVTMSSGNGATLTVGDYVFLKSTKSWSTDADAMGKQGEIHNVRTIASGVITLDRPIHDTYNTADTSHLRELTVLKNITLEGFTIKPESASFTGGLAIIKLVDNLIINNVEFKDAVAQFGSHLDLWSVVNADLNIHLTQSTTNTFNAQYGLNCVGACENVKCTAQISGRFRHGIVGANGSSSSWGEGVCRNMLYYDCNGEIGDVTLYDCHIEGDGISFVNCNAYGGIPTNPDPAGGFGIRSKNTRIIGGHVKDTIGFGIVVFDGANNCKIIGCTIDGVKRNSDTSDGYGIEIWADQDDVEIAACTIQNCGRHGIELNSNNDRIIIRDCIIKNNGLETTGYGINASGAAACVDCEISDCTISGNIAAINVTHASTSGWDIQGNKCNGNTNPSIIRGGSKLNTYRNNTGLVGFDELIVLATSAIGKYAAHALTTQLGGLGLMTGFLTALGTGTYALGYSDSEGDMAEFTTGTALNDLAGFRTNSTITRRVRQSPFYFRFAIDNTATVRIYIGTTSNSGAAMSGADPLNARHGVGIVVNASKFMIAHNEGTGATVFDDFDSARTVDTTTHNVKIIGTSTGYYIEWDDGVTSKTITTDVPSASQGMGVQAMIEATAASAARKLTISRFEGFF